MRKEILIPIVFFTGAFNLNAQDKEKEKVKQVIVKFFDGLSALDSAAIAHQTTRDFLLLEDGLLWNVDSLASKLPLYKTVSFSRTNHLDFTRTEIKGISAWVAYKNTANITLNGNKIQVKWLESAVLVREKKDWKIQMLHSTPLDDEITSKENEEATIRKLEENEREAILKGDTMRLKALMSRQVVVQNPENLIVGFPQIIQRIKNGNINYARFDRSIEKISFINDIAIVMGVETIVPQGESKDAGKVVKRRFTNVWSKENRTWKLIARQATIISVNVE